MNGYRSDRSAGREGRKSCPFLLSALTGSALVLGAAAPSMAQSIDSHLPFRLGEVLEYQVESSRFGEIGTARMTVGGPVEVRGRSVLVLSMQTEGRVTFLRFEDTAHSWFDPGTMASLRFVKIERHPLARRNESVEMFPAIGRWEEAGGEGGPLGNAEPLDELSFIYFLRALDLDAGDVHSLNRHFDPKRNPVHVQVLGRDTLTVPAGVFPVVIVEMRVRDDRRFDRGEGGTIRLFLSDDARRVPVRIESSAPFVGAIVMDLRSASPPPLGGDPRRSAANR